MPRVGTTATPSSLIVLVRAWLSWGLDRLLRFASIVAEGLGFKGLGFRV